jgi:hypothetical protein
VHLDEALDDQWIEYCYLASLLVQVISYRQIIGTRGFHHKQTLATTGLDKLLKTSFAIADFQVFDLLVDLITYRQGGFADVKANDGKRKLRLPAWRG